MKILKFFTETCMTCRVIGKILDKMDVEVVNINATEDLKNVDKYEICSTPTLIFLNENNEEVTRIVEPTSKSKIEEILGNNV